MTPPVRPTDLKHLVLSCHVLPPLPHLSPRHRPTLTHKGTRAQKKHTSARDKTTRPDRQKRAAGSREHTRSTSHVVRGEPQLVHAQWSPSVAPAQLYPPRVQWGEEREGGFAGRIKPAVAGKECKKGGGREWNDVLGTKHLKANAFHEG